MSLPTTDITTDIVKAAIGLNSDDVGTLCSNVVINPWARNRPGYLYLDSNNRIQRQLPRGGNYTDPRGLFLGDSGELFVIDDFSGYNHQAIIPSITPPSGVTCYQNSGVIVYIQLNIGEIDWMKEDNGYHPSLNNLPQIKYAMALMANSSGVALTNISFTVQWDSSGGIGIYPSSTPSSPTRSTLTFSFLCTMSDGTRQGVIVTLNPTDPNASGGADTKGDTITMTACMFIGVSPSFDNNYNYSAGNNNAVSLSGISQNGVISIPFKIPTQLSTGVFPFYFRIFLSTDGLSSLIDFTTLGAISAGSFNLTVNPPPVAASFSTNYLYKLTSTDINNVGELIGVYSENYNSIGYLYNAGSDSNSANNSQYNGLMYASGDKDYLTESPTGVFIADGLYTTTTPNKITRGTGSSEQYIYTWSVSQYVNGQVIAHNNATWSEYVNQ